MIIKNMRIGIFPLDNKIDKKQIYKELHDTKYKIRRACNYAQQIQLEELNRKLYKDKEQFGEIRKEKDVYNKSFGAFLENKMNEFIEGCLSSNIAQTRQFIMNDTNFNKSKIAKGEDVPSIFRNDNMPVILHNNSYKFIQFDKIFNVEIGLFNRKKQEELGVKRINFVIIKPDKSSQSIIEKLISKEYKQGSGQIIYNERKKKWELLVSYSFEPQKEEYLDLNKTLGIDLGIVNTATMSVYNSETSGYQRMNWKEIIINGQELIHYRQTIEARRKQLQIASKWASEAKTGHGYKKRMEDTNKLSNKCARFRDTYNHKVSKYIINLALKYNCGNIQIEDLSGFSAEQSERFLKNWSYYDLQQKVKYKAEEKGINVKFIKPNYTSKRCNVCGCIDENNRDCKNNQAKFECVKCGHKENADINASKNIAIPNIDLIIEDYLKNIKRR